MATKKMNVVIFDADKFGLDVVKAIQNSNAILLDRGLPADIYREILKTAIIAPDKSKKLDK
ncbi:hypothetical protein [Pedobacter sp.]